MWWCETLNQGCLKDYIPHISCGLYDLDEGIGSTKDEESLHKSNVLPDGTVVMSGKRSGWGEDEMFYFVKNKTTKTKPKMIREMGEEKQHQEREKRKEWSVHRSLTQSEEKKKENIKEDQRKPS